MRSLVELPISSGTAPKILIIEYYSPDGSLTRLRRELPPGGSPLAPPISGCKTVVLYFWRFAVIFEVSFLTRRSAGLRSFRLIRESARDTRSIILSDSFITSCPRVFCQKKNPSAQDTYAYHLGIPKWSLYVASIIHTVAKRQNTISSNTVKTRSRRILFARRAAFRLIRKTSYIAPSAIPIRKVQTRKGRNASLEISKSIIVPFVPCSFEHRRSTDRLFFPQRRYSRVRGRER